MIKRILDDLAESGNEIQAAIFLDGEGETIAQSGNRDFGIQLIGAWKEIHLDHVKDISKQLKIGEVRAVLFSRDKGQELVVPVADEFCLVLILSVYANFRVVLSEAAIAIERLKTDIG